MTAHDEGKTQLDGRTVERIRIDPPSDCPSDLPCMREPVYVYVDPETFDPVRGDFPGGVMRILTYEYLPRTAANLALTDIRAQHPNATGRSFANDSIPCGYATSALRTRLVNEV